MLEENALDSDSLEALSLASSNITTGISNEQVRKLFIRTSAIKTSYSLCTPFVLLLH